MVAKTTYLSNLRNEGLVHRITLSADSNEAAWAR